ncbi:UNVERIFIED_CONTAM: hypothetical protein HDU68_007484 [Siphonaria sp. JEL0065]|nr:hypothetical protein HDU68_007484 [Siphonaria sp. JEL0065]
MQNPFPLISQFFKHSKIEQIAGHILAQKDPEPIKRGRNRRRRSAKNRLESTEVTEQQEPPERFDSNEMMDIDAENEGEEDGEEEGQDDCASQASTSVEQSPSLDSLAKTIAFDSSVPLIQVLAGDEIWNWQYEQEVAVFSHFVQQSETQTNPGERIQLAIAEMWEPNRSLYGTHAWWALDQQQVEGELDSDADDVDMVQDQQEYIVTANTPLELEASTPEFSVGQTFSVTELFAPIETSSSKPNRKSRHTHNDDVLIGMEVDRDLIYDESELTPEEIEIQRWSIAWKAKRAAEIKQEEEEKLRDALLKQEQEQTNLERALLEQSYAFKAKTYPGVYGDASSVIIKLEAEIQKHFEESGGVGSVPELIPIGEEQEFYKAAQRKQQGTLLKSSAMVMNEFAERKVVVNLDLEDGEEEEGELEEGEMADDGEIDDDEKFMQTSSTRVLWPVLPIRS